MPRLQEQVRACFDKYIVAFLVYALTVAGKNELIALIDARLIPFRPCFECGIGCIVGGIGGILYYQEMTGDWASWAYMWTLIPGFVGVGVLLSGLIDRSGPRFESSSLILMAISAMGFLIFGGSFGFGLDVGRLWPIFIIGAGVITLLSALFGRKKIEE